MKDLTKGSPSRLILSFAIPIFFANLLQLTYSLVDTRIVGSFLGEDALAAVGATSTLSNLIIGFLLGLANGFAIITAQRYGAKDIAGVKKSFAASLMMGTGISVLLTAAGLIFLKQILQFLNVPEALFGTARSYIVVIVAGMLATFLYDACAAALRALYDSFFRGTEPPAAENPSVLFNRAADRVCRNCVLREDCWQSHYTDTYNAFNDACPQLLRRGRAEPEDFPLHFATRCVHFPALLAAIDRETHDYLLRRQYRQRLEHAQRQAREQYACLSELLDGAQPAAQAASWQPIGYRVSSTLRPREGNRLCGDQVDVFEVGASVYLLLCDGMGSGEEAHREAALTVRLLRQFLEAGIQPAPALKTLNTAMALRGQQGGGYSTIDLAELQREESVVSLFKYGAAPSYLKRGGTVRRICATDPPAGLSDTALPPDRLNLTVQAGDYLVLVSDGIADEKSDEWLLNLLAGWSGNGPDALTRLILSESRSRKGLVDDCAVVVLELPRGGENRKFPV